MADYSLDTPLMRLAEEVNEKYNTDAGKMLIVTYLFMVSKTHIYDEKKFWSWCEELFNHAKCDAVKELAENYAKKDWLHGGLDKPIFKHYKGGFYQVLGECFDSETLEEKVVYQALYGENEVWVRPKKMFFENVEVNGESVPRFKKASIGDFQKWVKDGGEQ